MPSAKDATRESNRVMTFSQWCERNSLSKITGWRILKAGDGPKVTQLSARRIGIREDHNAEWQNSRVRGE
jgi:predicted DNA-binding transcriptional regulator AlpA